MVLRQKRLVLSCPIPTHTPGAPTPKTPGDSVGCKATIYHSRAVRSSNRRQVSICNPVWARARQLWDATLRLHAACAEHLCDRSFGLFSFE